MISDMSSGEYTLKKAIYYLIKTQELPNTHYLKTFLPMWDFLPNDGMLEEYVEFQDLAKKHYSDIKDELKEAVMTMDVQTLPIEVREACKKNNFDNLTNTSLWSVIEQCEKQFGSNILKPKNVGGGNFDIAHYHEIIDKFDFFR